MNTKRTGYRLVGALFASSILMTSALPAFAAAEKVPGNGPALPMEIVANKEKLIVVPDAETPAAEDTAQGDAAATDTQDTTAGAEDTGDKDAAGAAAAAEGVVPEEMKLEVLSAMSRIIGSENGLALVDRDRPLAQAQQPHEASNIADPSKVRAAYRLVSFIGPEFVRSVPLVGDPRIEVQLTLLGLVSEGNYDEEGEKVAETRLLVDPADIGSLEAPLLAFLEDHMPIPDGEAGPFNLKMWLDVKDGGPLTNGSQFAVNFKATASGYVSLFSVNSDGSIDRLFPTKGMEANFVQEGEIYRFPASGYLELSQETESVDLRAIITSIPSNVSEPIAAGLSFRGEPVRIIPTTEPMMFANGDLSRIFAPPKNNAEEAHIVIQVQGSR